MSASAAHAAFERHRCRDQPWPTARVKETRACALGNPLMWSPFEPRRLVVVVVVQTIENSPSLSKVEPACILIQAAALRIKATNW